MSTGKKQRRGEKNNEEKDYKRERGGGFTDEAFGV